VALTVSSFSVAAWAASNPLQNGSFEDANVAAGGYRYSSAVVGLGGSISNVLASPWSFLGGSGVVADAVSSNYNNAWGRGASAGNNFAFLQGDSAQLTQAFTSVAASLYTV
jgi:hypothetical protein